jgi:hypothetical protein
MFAAGLYYRLVPAAGEGKLAMIQATLHIAGALMFPAGIALVLTFGTRYEGVAIGGALIVYAAVALFAFIVFRTTAQARAPLAEFVRQT